MKKKFRPDFMDVTLIIIFLTIVFTTSWFFGMLINYSTKKERLMCKEYSIKHNKETIFDTKLGCYVKLDSTLVPLEKYQILK